jgi:hypothetical protein
MRVKGIEGKDAAMDKINLGTVLEETISKFCQNRIGDKPALRVGFPPPCPWLCGKTRA